MTQIIRISGKARDVFGIIRQVAQKAGKLTIGELVRQIKEKEGFNART